MEPIVAKGIGSPRPFDDESMQKGCLRREGWWRKETSKSGICCGRWEIYLAMSDAEESYVQAFEEELSFRMFHRFLNEHKQYIYNKRIPNNTCLCEICELHVYFHSISSSQLILPQLQNINHVIVTLRNVCWGSVMNVMTMD